MQQQKDEFLPDFRKNLNFAYSLCSAWVVAMTLPTRKYQGLRNLGFPALFAFGLMFLWYVATADPGMLVWLAIWLTFLVIRRIEAIKLGAQVHSYYDGMPVNLGSNEYLAKRIGEPILFGLGGAILYWVYDHNGLSPTGLPYFFLLGGLVALPFVETVRRQMWERKIQVLNDAKLESEMLMEDFNNRKG